MKIIYFTNARLPTEKAHGVQIVKMCEAFALNGHEVTLVRGYRHNHIKDNLFDYYSIKKKFKVVTIPAIDFFPSTRFGYLLHQFSFSFFAFLYSFLKKFDLWFSREIFPLFFLMFFKKNTVYEMHDFPKTNLWLSEMLCKKVDKIVTTNTWSKKQCIQKFNINQNNIHTDHNGVDIRRFESAECNNSLKKKLDITQNIKVVMYSGHLYDWKGVDILADSVKYLPNNILIVFLGGLDSDVKKFKNKYKDISQIKILGRCSHAEVPKYLACADVLIVPNIAINQHSINSTSPIKLFEYLAINVPIIISDLPSMRDIVTDNEVLFVEPGDSKKLANMIKSVLQNKGEFDYLLENSKKLAKIHSWENRAKRIVSFVEKHE